MATFDYFKNQLIDWMLFATESNAAAPNYMYRRASTRSAQLPIPNYLCSCYLGQERI